MSNNEMPWRIVEITQHEYSHLKKALAGVQDALDTRDFRCKSCKVEMVAPLIRGGVFPICDECLDNLGKLSKYNRSWLLQ